jgi:hypothetical protein
MSDAPAIHLPFWSGALGIQRTLSTDPSRHNKCPFMVDLPASTWPTTTNEMVDRPSSFSSARGTKSKLSLPGPSVLSSLTSSPSKPCTAPLQQSTSSSILAGDHCSCKLVSGHPGPLLSTHSAYKAALGRARDQAERVHFTLHRRNLHWSAEVQWPIGPVPVGALAPSIKAFVLHEGPQAGNTKFSFPWRCCYLESVLRSSASATLKQ